MVTSCKRGRTGYKVSNVRFPCYAVMLPLTALEFELDHHPISIAFLYYMSYYITLNSQILYCRIVVFSQVLMMEIVHQILRPPNDNFK